MPGERALFIRRDGLPVRVRSSFILIRAAVVSVTVLFTFWGINPTKFIRKYCMKVCVGLVVSLSSMSNSL